MSSKSKLMVQNKKSIPPMVPKLRFPEFRKLRGWSLESLNTIAEPVTLRAIQGSPDNVLSLSAEHGVVLQSDFFGKKIAGNNSERYLKIARDDFVYNDRTTKNSTFGTIKRLSRYSSGIVSPIYKCFRFNPGQNPSFWEQYFESGSHNVALRSLVNEGARAGRFNISISQFLSTSACHPISAEQRKIADCLSSLDDLIAAQARKVETLKAHKKGLMQQLFPRDGETQPRLRFPEFRDAGEWEPRTLGSVCSTFSGGTPSTSKPEYYGGDIPFIRSAEIALNDTALFLTRDGLANSAAKLVTKGDILVALYGANSGDVALAKIDGAINQAILCMKSKESNAFIYQFFSFKKEQIVATYLQGGQGNLSGEIVKSIELSFCSPAEQQKIADCLSSLDDLIADECERLDALKTHKRALMQQLFPSPEDTES
jgi:type I restriction enzyme S subunit